MLAILVTAALQSSGFVMSGSPQPSGTYRVVPISELPAPKGINDPLEQLRITVTFREKQLWSGTLGIRGPYSASYGENLRSGSDERCPASALLNDLAYSFAVGLRHEGSQQSSDDDFRVNVNYTRSFRDEQCSGGTRSVVLDAPVRLLPGEVKEVVGDGGLVARIERLGVAR
jgi:hypothetical protein